MSTQVLANVRLQLQALEVELTGLEPKQAEDLIRFAERLADDVDFAGIRLGRYICGDPAY